LFEWQGIPYRLFLLADLFTFAWFMGLMYSIKIFDGLDGLVSGISIIAGLVLYFLSIAINLPGVALIALIFVGAQFGFLLFNFNPATIFLGEAGALFSGFMLAVLAVLGSGKVATTFLVLGIPLLDMCWVVFRRIFIEKKSPAKGDRKHLHHRFLDAGFTQKQAVLFMYLISASFGISALFLQSMGKLIAICVLVVCMALMGLLLFLRFKSIKKI
ncbi:undecaprenyl/decaprenyl-phosphate alpha-N-acetylglucosaminyl 1-phosphate transferase, partial [Patescibacteria group bacterium]|nr:undecaprenyl/decaprenyl-phosphate alpha-N-acetylglucosaminyl 1-phosphate transferase [Patescibacteria group bacterium]